MKYRYTDWPKFVPPETYHNAITKMVSRIEETGFSQAIYQVGSIGTPGISDIDLVVVLHENLKSDYNPVSELTGTEKYLFSHRLFGTIIPYALNMEPFVMFGKYKHLSGYNFNIACNPNHQDDINALKRQIALEYLLKAWISISVSIHFGIIKVRNFLLHAKGVLHDIAFLELRNTPLEACINRLVEYRENWFDKPLTSQELDFEIDNYEATLRLVIDEAMDKFNFYLPTEYNSRISKRIWLTWSSELTLKRQGIMLPKMSITSSKFLKFNQYINTFRVGLPYEQKQIPEIIQKRFNYLSKAFRYNEANLPGFICAGHAINIFTSSGK
jgi:hypothetical protein